MVITNRVKLGTTEYYVSCDCVYKKKNGHIYLCLRNYANDYYDGGYLSLLLRSMEEEYDAGNVRLYDSNIGFLDDALYIYDNIPFVAGIGDTYYLSDSNKLNSVSYITKEELDDYIKENNIVMSDHSNFKLSDGRTWLTYHESE